MIDGETLVLDLIGQTSSYLHGFDKGIKIPGQSKFTIERKTSLWQKVK